MQTLPSLFPSIASRLESMTRQINRFVVFSRQVKDRAEATFKIVALGARSLKGKGLVTEIFSVDSALSDSAAQVDQINREMLAHDESRGGGGKEEQQQQQEEEEEEEEKEQGEGEAFSPTLEEVNSEAFLDEERAKSISDAVLLLLRSYMKRNKSLNELKQQQCKGKIKKI